ncbi:MAG: VF530 family protein [Patescibacteria group bacterium]
MPDTSKDPLHGKTLKFILEQLVERYGWKKLALRIKINCFKNDPTISSSLVFLRKTPWAREKVEGLYLSSIRKDTPADNAFKPLNLNA